MGWRHWAGASCAMRSTPCPFFVNPMMARKSGCRSRDIDLMKFLIPHAYRNTASAIRPFVEVRHAWYAEHTVAAGLLPGLDDH